jgi:hypothetical protein
MVKEVRYLCGSPRYRSRRTFHRVKPHQWDRRATWTSRQWLL